MVDMVTWVLWLIIYADDGMWPIRLQEFNTKVKCMQALKKETAGIQSEYQCIPNIHIDREGIYNLE